MVLAHQGGWDEMLIVAIPLAVFAVLLFIANRKAAAQLEADEQRDDGPHSMRDGHEK